MIKALVLACTLASAASCTSYLLECDSRDDYFCYLTPDDSETPECYTVRIVGDVSDCSYTCDAHGDIITDCFCSDGYVTFFTDDLPYYEVGGLYKGSELSSRRL